MAELGQLKSGNRDLVQACEVIAADNVPQVMQLQDSSVQIMQRLRQPFEVEIVTIQNLEIEPVVDRHSVERVTQRSFRTGGQILKSKTARGTVGSGAGDARIGHAGLSQPLRIGRRKVSAKRCRAHGDRAGIHP